MGDRPSTTGRAGVHVGGTVRAGDGQVQDRQLAGSAVGGERFGSDRGDDKFSIVVASRG